MHNIKTLIFALFVLLVLSCKKQQAEKLKIVETLYGIVSETDDGFEIISDEQGLLIPDGALPVEFQKDGLFVTVTGILKVPRKYVHDGFPVTPIEIREVIAASPYNKTDISLSIIKSEDHGGKSGFGYFIEDLRRERPFRILQYQRPAVPGLDGFCSPTKATKTAIFVISEIRRGRGLPSVTPDLLNYIQVLNPCK